MKAYLTLSHGPTPLGTLRLTLRPDIVPKTVDNFVHFLTNRETDSSGGYKNSTFHRIIPKFMAQGGDFLNADGTGSASLYGRSFPDENFLLSHSSRGILSMANSGPDTNGCQFFVTFKACAHLDGRHVVFGAVDWREDEESARALDALEGVRTGRGDVPAERVQIVDCGIVEDESSKKKREGKGEKLRGEAKMNKLMMAYGELDAKDGGEIDLDGDGDNDVDEPAEKGDMNADAVAQVNTDTNDDEIDIEDENDSPTDQQDEPQGKPLTKKALLQKRLASLRTKINQSRTLNRREVHAEAKRMGTEEASRQERRRQNKRDKNARKEEYETYVAGKLVGEGGAEEEKQRSALAQPAYESIRKTNAKADKMERAQFGPDDYYNPEGQYSNYERNLKSVRNSRKGASASCLVESYDPTATVQKANGSEKEGAHRLAAEMKRRAEKRANKRSRPDFDAYDVSYINDRNKRFNEKISRNFDEHTAEIRQNLERGTAL